MRIRILKYSAFLIPIILIFLVGFFILKNEKKEVRIENNLQENIEEALSVGDEAARNASQTEAGGEAPAKIDEEENTEEIEIKKEDKIDAAIVTSIDTSKKDSLEITNKLVSFGFQKSSGRKIDTVIIHSSYDALGSDPYDISGLIKEYQQYGVAPHYLIDRDGEVYLLVEEKNIAYHAGLSEVPDGRVNVNAFSIGIEMMNTKTDKYTEEQYDFLKNLLKDIENRYEIKYTLGHDEIAPGRKSDPWNFNWDKIK